MAHRMTGKKGRSGGARSRSGFPPKRILIKAQEGASLRHLLHERHGYSAEEAIAGLLSGELATVLLSDEQRAWLITWLESQSIDDPLYADVPRNVAAQLRDAVNRGQLLPAKAGSLSLALRR